MAFLENNSAIIVVFVCFLTNSGASEDFCNACISMLIWANTRYATVPYMKEQWIV